MTIAELIKLRQSQQNEDSNSTDGFYGGYAKGWQDAYDDNQTILEHYGFDMNVEIKKGNKRNA